MKWSQRKVLGVRLDRPNLVLLGLCGVALLLQIRQTLGGMGSIPLSSHTCTGSGKANTTCVLHNVIVYKAKVYYVTLDPQTPHVPPLDITWRPESQFDIPFPIQQVDPDTLAAFGLATYSVVPNAVLWYRLDLVDNFYHMVAEHGATIHHLMCTYLGLCEYTAEMLTKFRIIFMDPKPASMWAAVNDNWSCFSSNRPIYFGEMHRSKHAYLLEKAVVGIGPRCRAFLFCMQDQFGGTMRQRLPSEQMASWRRRLHMCFGLDPNRSVTTATRPVIYLMNRAFESRRSFVNFDDTVAAVKAAYPTADVRALYLENRNLVEQARAFSEASVIFLMHGAQFGNLPFMAHDAVIIEAMPFMPDFDGANDHTYYQLSLVKELAPVSGITMLEYDSPFPYTTNMRMKVLVKDPKYNPLAPWQKVDLLEKGTCPSTGPWEDKPYRRKWCKIKWFLKASDVEIDMELARKFIDQALRHIRERGMQQSGSKEITRQLLSVGQQQDPLDSRGASLEWAYSLVEDPGV